MNIEISRRDALLGSGSLISLINTGSIYVYSGPVPATAGEAVNGASTLLVTINNGGTGVTFNATPANGVLVKTASETWSGTAVATATATFYRFCLGADNGGAVDGTGIYRIQGTVGGDASYDMVFTYPAITIADVKTLNTFQLYLPL